MTPPDNPEIQLDKTAPTYTIDQALTLKLVNGLSYAEIGKMFNRTPQAIHERLQPIMSVIKGCAAINLYERSRVALLTAGEYKLLLSSLDDEAISKAGLGERSSAFQKLHNARRLETDQSTENIANTHKVDVMSEDTQGKLDRLIGNE